ncbi:MAG: T9SS type A sorting domain-containing protein [Bacteroidota bacterium]
MRIFFILLVIGCSIPVSVIGQQIPDGPNPLARLTNNHQEFRSHRSLMQDSTPLQIVHQRQRIKSSPAKKSKTDIKQKMDSSHVQRYQSDFGGLATLNRDKYAYDSEGRLIMAVSYTCNTWDEQYHWYKDTAAFDTDGNQTLEASYTRDIETEPWILEYSVESYYDARGNDTLSINYFLDSETNEWIKEKYVSAYDGDLITTVYAYQLNESTGEWEVYGRIENMYDSKGNSLAQSTYLWSEDTGDWIHCAQVEFTYDPEGNITSYIYYYFNTLTRVWRGWSREEYTYDSGGHMIQYTGFGWSSTDGYWVPQDKESSAYDLRGNETEFITYSWNSEEDQWTPERKSANVFDANGNLTEYYRYNWNSGGNQWISRDKELNVYDQKGHLTEYINYLWSSGDNQWIPANRILYTYDSNGKTILISVCGWDAATGTWSESSRNERDYNDAGDLIQTLSLGSKDSTSQWTSKFLYDYTYNNFFTDEEIVTPYGWSGEVPVHMLTKGEGLRWDNSTRQWYTFKLQEYYYSGFSSGIIPKTHLSKIRFFPNPAIDVIYVVTEQSSESAHFEMSDLQGREIYSANLTGTRNQIPVGNLPGGVYLYQIIREGEYFYGKIVKR